jgi:hypothetical protein
MHSTRPVSKHAFRPLIRSSIWWALLIPILSKQFREVDLASIKASVMAARRSGIQHLIYVNVAHPAPIKQMVASLVLAVENPVQGIKITMVPEIRNSQLIAISS